MKRRDCILFLTFSGLKICKCIISLYKFIITNGINKALSEDCRQSRKQQASSADASQTKLASLPQKSPSAGQNEPAADPRSDLLKY
jgi:hypothetical protein